MVVSYIVLLEYLKQKNTIWTHDIILLGNNIKELIDGDHCLGIINENNVYIKKGEHRKNGKKITFDATYHQVKSFGRYFAFDKLGI